MGCKTNEYCVFDFSTPEKIESYAQKLQGMTFRDVLDLGITPEGTTHDYSDRAFKGGVGTLIEERFFGYKANSDQNADFADAGVELKTTCFDVKKNGEYSAGERLVLTMIPMNKPIEDDFYSSHAWDKSSKIMLIYYQRDKSIDKYDQQIKYVSMFTPPEEDLKIIEHDYEVIRDLVQSGKAEELSESLTTYLGACTKGANEATMWVEQFYPPHNKAKKRAFCFKRQYMDYVLHHYIMNEKRSDSIISNVSDLENMTFEELVLHKINSHIGKTDRELCQMLEIPYTGNKAQWTTITYSLLGVRGDKAEEFEKANISVRTVRIEETDTVKESLSLDSFKFKELIEEDWDNAPLHNYFEETRFLFVSFRKKNSHLYLAGARFWAMPQVDINGPLYQCWKRTRDVVRAGVEFSVVPWGGSERIENNLPKKTGNPVAHVRPHTAKSWYRFSDGTCRGENPAYGDELPDGREMTKQSFWLNSDYIYSIVSTSK